MEKKIDYSEVFRAAWAAFKSQPWILVGLVVAFMIVSSLMSMLAPLSDGKTITVMGVVVMIIQILLQCIFMLGYYKITLQAIDGEEPQFSVFGQMGGKFFTFLGAYIIFMLVVTLGSCLLIVPGIYLAIRLQFAPFAIVDEDAGVIDSLKRSWEITDGYTLNLFVIFLMMGGILLLGILACFIGLVVAYPLMFLMQCYVFRKLTASRSEVETF